MEKFRKAYIRTYGCKQNFADSEKITGLLLTIGYDITKSPEEADLILLNTCAVRENAEQRVFGNVGALKKLKEDKPKLIIILFGCMTQQEHTAEKFKAKFSFIDAIAGTNILSSLPEIIEQARLKTQKGARIILKEAGADYDSFDESVKPLREGLFSANVPIMNGCDNFCTYCVVPLVRGREVSRTAENVISEVKNLIAEGRRDILLLGQNVNSYGKGNSENTDFTGLLRELDALEGEFIIGYMTSHPKDCKKELIDFIAGSRNISRHLHLPVQSGSNRILELMNRGYTREKYIELAEYAKEKIPGISLTTDILVGFPGETYEDFKETLDLVEKIGFDSAYTFIYSKREGTIAAGFADPISDEEKSAWFRELLDVQNKINERSYERFVGKVLRVLCLGEGRSNPELLTGKSRQGIIVDFAGGEELHGKFADVRIKRALPWALIGDLII
ncbi:MAG: tRNA (N6-isopentenyl adenosine(37)-C2)-methylthiotransferase MiaB [Oscillospiraceae bacterium]|jgi:tRNA-2-methylthio-N6-dimethylallyladenosine synthase|nr:tRNA (N6-isopentenyl adenosine(37)-C2)-methylthiotransferase MiaB [Oscillospiraceae bacterium]